MSAEGDAHAAAAQEQAVTLAAIKARVDARLSQVDAAAYAAFRANWAPLEEALALRGGSEPIPDEPAPGQVRGN